ncbi:hypothetical protein AB1N83_013453, partial [Pleurotus pulmonarius]
TFEHNHGEYHPVSTG